MKILTQQTAGSIKTASGHKTAFGLVTLITLKLLSLTPANAQEQDTIAVERFIPDLKKIENIVKNDTDRYNSLMDRFNSLTVTMEMLEDGPISPFTFEESAIIYYGYAFTEQYNPYHSYDSLRVFIQQRDWEKAEQAALEALKDNPVCIELLEHLILAAEQRQDEEVASRAFGQYIILLTTISRSGEGKTPDSPLFVIRVSDEYSILRSIGASQLKGQSLIDTPSGKCDKMVFMLPMGDTDGDGIENEKEYTLYFNVGLPLGWWSKQF